jgi:hypothetical protein
MRPEMRQNMAKQLTMLTKRPEEMDAMLAKTEASMRQMMEKNPMARGMILAQLRTQFAAVGSELDESGDIVATMLSKVREGTQFMREQMQQDADDQGVSFDEILKQKLDALNAAGSAENAAAMARNGGAAGGPSASPQQSAGPPRFKAGDLVSARIGTVGDHWENGRIVVVGYREPHFPAGFVAPYQIELSGNRLIYAPYDNDEVVRLRSGTFFSFSQRAHRVRG